MPPLSKGGGLTASHKLLPCNVLLVIHPSFLFTKLFRRQDGGIATPTLHPAPTLPKPHYPTRFAPSPLPYERSVGFASLQSLWAFNFGHPCPSLVKGEVLSPEKIRATTGGIATPTLRPAPALSKTHYPSPRTKLASLVKGRWIDGKPQTVTLLHLLVRCLPFLYCKLFCRQDGGIATPTLRPAPTLPKPALSLENRQHPCHMNALLVSHPCETLGVQLRASMPVPCQREVA